MKFPRLLLSALPVALTFFAAASVAAAGDAAPAIPTPRLEQPAAGSTTVSPFPRFHWERLPGTLDHRAPLVYEIEIARDTEFRDIVDIDRVNLARYIADRPLDPGNYHWRVRAQTAAGEYGEWSQGFRFTIAPCDETIRLDLNGSGEALPALRQAMAKAGELSRAGRSVRIVVPKGNYSLTPEKGTGLECVSLRGVSNVIVDFGGSSFSIRRWGIGFIEVQGSRNVSFLNATLDWDQELPFTQGIVTATDLASSKITVRLEPGFPEFDVPYFVKSGYFGILLHPNVPGRMKAGVPGHFEFQSRAEVKIGDRLWELPVSGKNHTRHFEVGDRFVRFARHGARSLADSRHSEQITYYGITNYTNPGSLHYTSLHDNELAVLHCRALVKEGRWFGGSADGVHAKGHRIGPWIEGFVVDGIGDDAIAFYTRPAKIQAAHVDGDPRVFRFDKEWFNLEPGDRVVFFNPRQGIYYDEAVVVETRPEGELHRVVFDRDLPKPEKVGGNPVLADQVWNRSKSCGDFMIRHCRLTNVRRFGAVFRALGGVVEDNHIEATSSSGILSLNEPPWPNGPMSSELLIQNNTLENNSFDAVRPQLFGAIALVTCKHFLDLAEGRGHSNVLIRGNTITDWHAQAINISGATDVTLADNTILSKSEPFVHDNNTAIRVYNAKNITLRNNTVRDQRPGYQTRSIENTTGLSE